MRLRGQAEGSAVLGFAYTPSNARGSLLAAAVFRPGTGSFTLTSIGDRVVGWDLAMGADGTAHLAYTRTAASNTSAVGRLSTVHVPATGNVTVHELASYTSLEVQLENGIRVPSLAVNASGVVMVGGARASLGRAPFYAGTASGGFTAIGEATGTYPSAGNSALFLDASGRAFNLTGLRCQLYR